MIDISLHISIDELCEKESVDTTVILEVVEYGIAKPLHENDSSEWTFDIESAFWIKKAIKLNQQLLLDWVAISLIIDLMKKKEALADENKRLKSRLERLL
jgi:chaperone modulatory protein CbpM